MRPTDARPRPPPPPPFGPDAGGRTVDRSRRGGARGRGRGGGGGGASGSHDRQLLQQRQRQQQQQWEQQPSHLPLPARPPSLAVWANRRPPPPLPSWADPTAGGWSTTTIPAGWPRPPPPPPPPPPRSLARSSASSATRASSAAPSTSSLSLQAPFSSFRLIDEASGETRAIQFPSGPARWPELVALVAAALGRPAASVRLAYHAIADGELVQLDSALALDGLYADLTRAAMALEQQPVRLLVLQHPTLPGPPPAAAAAAKAVVGAPSSSMSDAPGPSRLGATARADAPAHVGLGEQWLSRREPKQKKANCPPPPPPPSPSPSPADDAAPAGGPPAAAVPPPPPTLDPIDALAVRAFHIRVRVDALAEAVAAAVAEWAALQRRWAARDEQWQRRWDAKRKAASVTTNLEQWWKTKQNQPPPSPPPPMGDAPPRPAPPKSAEQPAPTFKKLRLTPRSDGLPSRAPPAILSSATAASGSGGSRPAKGQRPSRVVHRTRDGSSAPIRPLPRIARMSAPSRVPDSLGAGAASAAKTPRRFLPLKLDPRVAAAVAGRVFELSDSDADDDNDGGGGEVGLTRPVTTPARAPTRPVPLAERPTQSGLSSPLSEVGPREAATDDDDSPASARDSEREPSPTGTIVMEPIRQDEPAAPGAASTIATSSQGDDPLRPSQHARPTTAGSPRAVVGDPPSARSPPAAVAEDGPAAASRTSARRPSSDDASSRGGAGSKRAKLERSPPPVDPREPVVPKPDGRRRYAILENAAFERHRAARSHRRKAADGSRRPFGVRPPPSLTVHTEFELVVDRGVERVLQSIEDGRDGGGAVDDDDDDCAPGGESPAATAGVDEEEGLWGSEASVNERAEPAGSGSGPWSSVMEEGRSDVVEPGDWADDSFVAFYARRRPDRPEV